MGVGVGVDVGGRVGAGVWVGVAVATGTGVDVGSLGLSDGLDVAVGLRRVGRAWISAGGAGLGAARAGIAEKAMLEATITINVSKQKNAPLVCARCPKRFSFVTAGYGKVTVSIYPFYTI